MLWTVAAKASASGDLGTCLPLGRLRVIILSVSGPKDCEERKREEGGKECEKEGRKERERRMKGKKKEGERGE